MSSATGRWRESPPTAVKNEEDNGRCPRELRVQSEAVLAGRYRLEERLGRGGMGEVWRAFDPHLEREVAVKLILSGDNDGVLIRRFQREARISANIQHPNITAVHDFGHHEGQLFLVMELLRGRDLGAVLADHPQGMPLDLVVSVAVQAADALLAQHLTQDPPPIREFRPDVPLELADLVARMMAKDPAARPDSHELGELIYRAAAPEASGSPAFFSPQIAPQALPTAPPTAAPVPPQPSHATGYAAPSQWMPAAPQPHPTAHPPAEGDPQTMFTLGLRHREQGDIAGAESWYRKAAEAGHLDSMFNLALLSRERGNLVEAESWYRRAAEVGDVDAMVNLGDLLKERGESAEAELWHRRAAEAGHIASMHTLGNLLYSKGDTAEAETWWRRAAEAGNIRAMGVLGNLLEQRGDTFGAEQWYRRAAEAGNLDAMVNLGVLLENRHDTFGAEQWYRRAADAGDIDAMVNLGNLLHGRGDMGSAQYWWQRAAQTGNTRALNHLNQMG